jgi:hypothetical protein
MKEYAPIPANNPPKKKSKTLRANTFPQYEQQHEQQQHEQHEQK